MIHDAEVAISRLLKYGVYLCGLILAVGCALEFFNSASMDLAQSRLLQLRHGQELSSPMAGLTFSSEISGVIHLQPEAWLILGLALLIALPILRVAATVIVFAVERDRVYVVLSSIVLAVLLLSAYLGKAV